MKTSFKRQNVGTGGESNMTFLSSGHFKYFEQGTHQKIII
jgi:hypothetical protein